jgi:RNA polymerase sigma-70 factor (ECF subfamily)
MAESDTDETLMLRYQAGDGAAFDKLYARHRGALYRFIQRQCRAQDAAAELFQDVWMNLIQAKDRYRVEAQFRTYLFTLAHNRVMDFFRSHARTAAQHIDGDCDDDIVNNIPASRTAEPEVRALSREQGAALLKLLDALPDAQREAFLLHEEGGLNVEEIAAAMGITFEAAKSRLRYAVAKLRDGLREFA